MVKPEFSPQILEKNSNTKFQENPSSGSLVVPCGQTHRQDEANNCFSAIMGTRLKRVAKCLPPISNQASYLPEAFTNTRGSYNVYLNLGTTSIILGRGKPVCVEL